MTDEEMAYEYLKNLDACKTKDMMRDAFLAGLKAGKKEYTKIYMLGRKDERERPCSLCSNPRSICKRWERYRKSCYGSDIGVYVSACEDFIYKEVSE